MDNNMEKYEKAWEHHGKIIGPQWEYPWVSIGSTMGKTHGEWDVVCWKSPGLPNLLPCQTSNDEDFTITQDRAKICQNPSLGFSGRNIEFKSYKLKYRKF